MLQIKFASRPSSVRTSWVATAVLITTYRGASLVVTTKRRTTSSLLRAAPRVATARRVRAAILRAPLKRSGPDPLRRWPSAARGLLRRSSERRAACNGLQSSTLLPCALHGLRCAARSRGVIDADVVASSRGRRRRRYRQFEVSMMAFAACRTSRRQ